MPKGGKSSLVPVKAGLREDLDNFLKIVISKKCTTYSDYKKLFGQLGMAAIYNGRSYYAEIIEFNECLLCMCLKYIEEYISPGVCRIIEERLFGIFSLYTFFYLQTADHVVKIRMDPDMCLEFRKFSNHLKQCGYLDAYACCMRLFEDRAIKIVAFINVFDPSCHRNFDTDDDVEEVVTIVNKNIPMSNIRNLIPTDQFFSMDAAHELYQDAIMEICPELESNFNNPVAETKRIIEKYEMTAEQLKAQQKINDQNSNEIIGNRGIRRLALKEKAYSSKLAVDRNRRHRNPNESDNNPELFTFTPENNAQGDCPIEECANNGEQTRVAEILNEIIGPEEDVKPLGVKRGRKRKVGNAKIKKEVVEEGEGKPAVGAKSDSMNNVAAQKEALNSEMPNAKRARIPKKRKSVTFKLDITVFEIPNRFDIERDEVFDHEYEQDGILDIEQFNSLPEVEIKQEEDKWPEKEVSEPDTAQMDHLEAMMDKEDDYFMPVY